ncbi:helix-turn-helix domain-containing protein [Serratia liquefaciens]|jgi:transcriptional regulator with XRE-family HTH domain|uniref:helix-turn-helix domain-containing protein n=1 Tax=Serratia liquefaciens TaxID=614 RepID=UPI0021C8905B|nr:helix-turn-helix transcriptional regulator [Serratia liquefaciens]MCH4196702.1 helix-turn-helix domain-containing protein [Serratia liquefaciens]MCH4233446.1 helix-turn-helix domain-containing protein [Serratia liquefaciens]MCH4261637.1 helix-turn-helix domain-containing protein [Serratia liquefaciens]MCI1214170.1 helix-turn-helix domain-containing protein [Serratia liquefaciens]MCI1235524.1 helix-turn-helix domain-containing protein [Serratia liquefaciens]
MLTPFGKKVRKLRIDVGVTLKSMADAMGVTSSYLSAIETGKRAVTDPVLKSIISYFTNEGVHAGDELTKAARDSQQSVEINLSGKNHNAREVAMAFARNFDELNDDEFKRLRELLTKKQ